MQEKRVLYVDLVLRVGNGFFGEVLLPVYGTFSNNDENDV